MFAADDALVMWTSHKINDDTSEIFSMLAEQELQLQKQGEGEVAFQPISFTRNDEGEYWVLEADYNDERIFYADFKFVCFHICLLACISACLHMNRINVC